MRFYCYLYTGQTHRYLSDIESSSHPDNQLALELALHAVVNDRPDICDTRPQHNHADDAQQFAVVVQGATWATLHVEVNGVQGVDRKWAFDIWLQAFDVPIGDRLKIAAGAGQLFVDGVEVFNPGSRQQIAKRLQEKGWKPKKFTEKGQAIVDESTLAGGGRTPIARRRAARHRARVPVRAAGVAAVSWRSWWGSSGASR